MPRKNSWQLPDHVGHSTANRIEHLLDRVKWDVDALRDRVRDYVVEHLGRPDAVPVADETQAIKKGRRPVGVARQYCGATGQVENCQVMPMLTYASVAGHAFINRRLYLPEAWAGDLARRADAGVPEQVVFRTKPELVNALLRNGLGRYPEAMRAAQQALYCQEYPGMHYPGIANWAAAELIEASARSGMTEIATDIYRWIAEMTSASGTNWALGVEARSRAGDGRQCCQGPVPGLDHAPWPEPRPRGTRARPSALRGMAAPQRRRGEAREHLRTAHDMLEAMGWTPSPSGPGVSCGTPARPPASVSAQSVTGS